MNAMPHEVYFTSDTHFGHEKIISFCKRPYASVEEMTEALVANWNARVRPTDTIYHLGDFSMFDDKGALEVLSRLNGRKVLVAGNHDSRKVRASDKWEAVYSGYHELKMDYRGNPMRIVLSHYPIEDWRWRCKGGIHFHGHVHGTFKQTEQRMDVGVDCWEYRPMSLGELIARGSGFDPYMMRNWHDKAKSLLKDTNFLDLLH